MAASNINVLLQLQADRANMAQVKKSIEKGVGDLEIKFEGKNLAKARGQIKQVGDEAQKAGKKAEYFAEVVTLRGKSFAAFGIASQFILKLTGAISNATREAIKLEGELAKIAQTVNKSLTSIKAQSSAVLEISKNYGVASNKVAELIRLLTQTGLSFKEATKGAETLARTSLLASFDNLRSTTEGLIAIMNSFELSTENASKGLEVINVLSKRFAVESGDIVEAVKRTGGAFKAAGGNLNELAALFTAVRSTSRESAETIATAFRTIFGRLQRPKTIEFFKKLNIELADAEGNFIGPKNAIFAISEGLEKLGITAGSIRFAEVAEQIGGIRQLSKVVPLLTQTAKARRALAEANNAEAESDRDVQKAKQTLGQQLAELTQNFRALIAEVSESATFKVLSKTFLTVANAAIEIGRALKPILPLIAILGTIKLSKGLLTAIKFVKEGGVSGIKGLESDIGGTAKGFNRGGIVPGSGNSDTVPAMLTPGEFVIRKSAVQAFGAGNLGKINKYKLGGKIEMTGSEIESLYPSINAPNKEYTGVVIPNRFTVNSNALMARMIAKKRRDNKLPVWQAFEESVAERRGLYLDNSPTGYLDYPKKPGDAKLLRPDQTYGLDEFKGNNNETYLSKTVGAGKYKKGVNIGAYYVNNPNQVRAVVKKYSIGENKNDQKYGGIDISKFAKGGPVGTDTVPALLTPGEFVINQKSAKAFGYANLGRINKYAKGGVVQRFQDGGLAKSSGAAGRVDPVSKQLTSEIAELTQFIQDAAGTMEMLDYEADELVQTITQLEKNSEILYKSRAEGAKGQKAAAKLDALRAKKEAELVKLLEKKASVESAQLAAAGERESKIGEVRTRKKAGIGTLTEGRTGTPSADPSRPLAELKKVEESLKDVGDAAEKTESAFGKIIKSAAAWSVAVQGVLGGLEQFGVKLQNKELFQASADQATALGSYSEVIKTQGEAAGKKLGEWGKQLSKEGSKFPKLGKFLTNVGPKIAGFAAGVAKAGNVLGLVSLAGGLLAGIFTKDFKKVAKQQEELGNVAAAGAAAQKAYAQELNKSIPIIGGFLNLFGADLSGLFGNTEVSNLVKGTSELTAATNRLKKVDERLAKEMGIEVSRAIKSGDLSKVSELVSQRTAGVGDLVGRSDKLAREGQKALDYWWASNRKKGIEAIQASNRALDQAIASTKSIFDGLQPSLQQIAKANVLAGGSAEDYNEAVKRNIKDIEKLTGGAIGRATQEVIRARIKAAQSELDKVDKRSRGGLQLKGDAELRLRLEKEIEFDELRLANNQAAEAVNQLAFESAKAAQLISQEFLATLKETRALKEEFRAFDKNLQGVSNLSAEADFARTGQLNKSVALKQLGIRDVVQGDTKDLRTQEGADKFITAAGLIGEEAQKSAIKVVGQQKALQDFLDDPEKIIGKPADTGTDAFKDQARDIVDKLDLGDSISNETRKLLEKQIADAEGDPLKITEAIQKVLGDSSEKTAEEIKSRLEKIAELAPQAQQQWEQVYSQERQLLNRRSALARESAALTVRLEEERIASLEKIGLNSKDSLSKRKALQKKELADIVKANDLEGSNRKFEINELKRQGLSAKLTPGALGKKQAVDEEVKKREDALIDVGGRTLTKEGIESEIKARQKGISIMVEEEQARRENTKALQEARGALLEDLAFGTDEARQSLLEDANVAATALSRGSMAGFTGEQRQQTQRFLGRFTGLGGDIGKQAREAKGQLGAQELLEQGLITPQQFKQVASDIARSEIPVDEKVSEAISNEYKVIEGLERGLIGLKDKQLTREEAIQQQFADSVDKFSKEIDEKFEVDLKKSAEKRTAAEKAVFDKGTEDAKERKVESDKKIEELKKEEEKLQRSLDARKKAEAEAEKALGLEKGAIASEDPKVKAEVDKKIQEIEENASMYRERLRDVLKRLNVDVTALTDSELIEIARSKISDGSTKDVNQSLLNFHGLERVSAQDKSIRELKFRQKEEATREEVKTAQRALSEEQERNRKLDRRIKEDFKPRIKDQQQAAGAGPVAAVGAKAKKDSSEAVAQGVKKAQQQAPAAAGAPVGPEEAKVRKRFEEEDKKTQETAKKIEDAFEGVPRVGEPIDLSDRSREFEEEKKAKRQAEIEAARKKDQAAAGAAPAAAGAGPVGPQLSAKQQKQQANLSRLKQRAERELVRAQKSGDQEAEKRAKLKVDSLGTKLGVLGLEEAKPTAPAAAGPVAAGVGAGPVSVPVRRKPLSTEDRLERNLERLRNREGVSPSLIEKREKELQAVRQRKAEDAEKRQQKVKVENGGSVKVVIAAPGLIEGLAADTDQRIMGMLSKTFASVSDKLTGAQNIDEVKSAFSSEIDVLIGGQNGETATA